MQIVDSEVLLKGPTLMSHYLDDPEATAAAFTDDGWLKTGDLGVIDDNGNLKIVGRAKDMFIVGGFNAYPAEIENLLRGHPSIAQVAVIGIPDERLGEVGMAFVVAEAGTSPTEDEIVTWARSDGQLQGAAPRCLHRRTTHQRDRQGREERPTRDGDAMSYWLFLPQMRMTHEAITERALAAEAAGFEGIAFMDHMAPPLAFEQPMWDAITTASWVLAKTTTLQASHLVLCDSFRHPAVLAREALSLDHASGGRFELGIGWGSVPTEFPIFGIGSDAPRDRVRRLGESLEIMPRAVDGRRRRLQRRVLPTRGRPIRADGRPARSPSRSAASGPRRANSFATTPTGGTCPSTRSAVSRNCATPSATPRCRCRR